MELFEFKEHTVKFELAVTLGNLIKNLHKIYLKILHNCK